MKTLIAALVATVLGATVAPAHAQDRPTERHIQSGGGERTYLLAGPQSTDAVPLVIALHGGGGNAQTMVPRWLSTAQREGFVVAFPQGVSRTGNMGTWNAEGCCGFAMTSRSDDVAFISAVIDDVSRQRMIDPKRIYVTGLSNGGMLTYRLAREIGSRLAGVAVVSGAMFGGETVPVDGTPILIMHGARDEIVPYAGGQSPMALVARSQTRAFLPVERAVDFWRRADGCEGAPRTTVEGDVTVSISTGCRSGSEVVLYRLGSAGHGWPGPALAVGGLERDRYEEIDATQVIWRFFSAHSR